MMKPTNSDARSPTSEPRPPTSDPLSHTYCVIMAGGKGERFWPLSADSMPKPFLKLTGDKTMIQLTVERLLGIVPRERVFVVLGEAHVAVARAQLPDLPPGNFIVEPEGRDTAPCIGYAAIWLLRNDPEAVMVVLPADHYIPDVDRFSKTVVRGVGIAVSGHYLVTIGIKPVRPETGYGYIKAHEAFSASKDGLCFKVEKFVEKPDLERATSYLADGNYYWNAGMFIWRVDTVLLGMERHMPELYVNLLKIGDALAVSDKRNIAEIYHSLTRKSIDYGLMERAENVLMILGEFRWDDVGTWSSLLRVMEPDENGNYRTGNTLCLNARDSVIYSDGTLVAAIGVSDLVIVASKNGILVCDTEHAQEVREIARLVQPKKEGKA